MNTPVRFEHVRNEGSDHAAITLDSDHNRNALSAQLLDELAAALEWAARQDVQAVLLQAEGKAFCAGADLAEAQREGIAASARRLVRVLRAIMAHPLPIVARVHGPVRAGGIGVVAACDFVVAADHVTYAFTEAKLGLTPAVISLSVLPRMHYRVASTTFLKASTFDADAALDSGLITHVAETERLDETVAEILASLGACEPQGLAATKALLNADALAYLDDRADHMVEVSSRLFESPVARSHFAKFLNSS